MGSQIILRMPMASALESEYKGYSGLKLAMQLQREIVDTNMDHPQLSLHHIWSILHKVPCGVEQIRCHWWDSDLYYFTVSEDHDDGGLYVNERNDTHVTVYIK
jgi:hypothetical protein